MAFHAGVPGAAGGLLGVDIFFVLSGFLVTSLLVDEQARTGRIALLRFWARRGLRLLPALLLLLLGVCAYARWASTGLSPARIRGDAVATLLYAANWHYIITGQDYFVRFGAPSLLLHTWSLAVEEQFYLVWPVVALVVLRRWGRRGLAWAAGGTATASATACGALYLAGATTSRLYYGADTRAQSIMAGALLAVVLPSLRARFVAARPWGIAGLAGAGVLAACLHWVNGDGPFLYLGGFLVVAIGSAAVVALTAVRPDNQLSRTLSWSALRYVGRISYGLYLYHWPLFLLLTARRTGLHGWPLLVLRFAVTFAAAHLSFRFVERPIRSWGSGSSTSRVRPRIALAVAPVLVAVAVVTATRPGSTPPASSPSAPSGVASTQPVRAVLVGDSMALTLGAGLGNQATAWGVSLINKAVVGCDLDPTTTVNVAGDTTRTAQGCPDWRRSWSDLVGITNPDVVLVLLGRWECLSRFYQGRWVYPGTALFDDHLRQELETIIDIGSSRGARVVFLTLPYIAETTVQPDGSPWPADLPARTNAYNADVRAAVARHPDQATVVDLNRLLDPSGRYTSFISGIRVRSFDDEHISPAGGLWLRPYILPELARVGRLHPTSGAGSA